MKIWSRVAKRRQDVKICRTVTKRRKETWPIALKRMSQTLRLSAAFQEVVRVEVIIEDEFAL